MQITSHRDKDYYAERRVTMLEWIIIFYGLIMEALIISRPHLELGDTKFLKSKGVWAIGVSVFMLTLSLSYLIYAIYWAASSEFPIRICGTAILCMSFLSMCLTSTGHKRKPLWRRIDGAVCFVCLTLIGYARTKGW